MVIREQTIIVIYHADCGLDIVLKHYPDDTVSVSSFDPAGGSSVFHGNYKTRNGAMIAIGKIFGKGKYRFVKQYSETREELHNIRNEYLRGKVIPYPVIDHAHY